MIGDRLFVVDVQRAAQVQSKYSPVYFYEFDYRGKQSLSDLMSNTNRDFGKQFETSNLLNQSKL
jgi:carboxylesterase type B